MAKKTDGRTASGTPITDDLVDKLAAKAEVGVRRDRDSRSAELRHQLVEQLRTGDGLDADAAYEAREHGWSH